MLIKIALEIKNMNIYKEYIETDFEVLLYKN